ncbi:hypothetical protein MHTCC0001_28960 [Flavobacteriaceae bacterium MHTCC 0001]
MNKYLLYMFLILCAIQEFHSQEQVSGASTLALPVRNSLKFNKYVLNPTFSLVREQNRYISFTNKRQWVQFENAPETYLFSYSGRFQENIGAGVGLFQQNVGVLSMFGGILNFAYNVPLSRYNNLTFGLNLGAYQSGINNGKITVNTSDPALENIPSNFLMTINPGINYGTEFFDIGLSINNLVSYNLTESAILEEDPEQAIQAHVMYTGYMDSRGFFDESKFTAFARTEFKSDVTVLSGLVMLTVPKGIWAQVGYNTLYGASAGLGFNITNNIALEYNYEQSMGELIEFGNSHEITIAYKLRNRERFDYGDEDEEEAIFQPKKKKVKAVSISAEERERIAQRRAEVAAQRKAAADAKRAELVKAKEERIANEKARQESLEAKRLERLEAEKQAREEAARLAAEQQKAAEEAARLEAERKAKAEEEARQKRLAEEKAREEAAELERQRLEAEKQAREEAARLAAEEQKAAEEAARLEAERKAKAEEEARQKRLAEEKAREEAAELERQRLEAEKQAREEAARLAAEQQKAAEEAARLEAERKTKAEEEARQKRLAEEKAREEAAELERQRLEAEKQAREEAARLAAEQQKAAEEAARLEAERKAKAEEEARQKRLAEEKAREEAAELERQRLEAEKQAREEAARLAAEQQKAAEEAARLEAERKAKAEEEARQKRLAEEKAREEAAELERQRLEAEKQAREEAARLAAEQQKAAEEAARLEAERKAKAEEEARQKRLAEEKAREEAAELERQRLEAEKQAREEAARLAAEQQKAAEEAARLEAERKAKAEEEARQKRLAEEKAREEAAELERQRLEAEKKARGEAPVANDAASQSMKAIAEDTKALKRNQDQLLSDLSDKIAVKQQDLDDMKRENDLSEQGIVQKPKRFKSTSAENAAIQRIKDNIEKAEKEQEGKIAELEALLGQRKKKVKNNSDEVNKFYTDKLNQMKSDLSKIKEYKKALVTNLDEINEATDIERKRRIKRGTYDNQQVRYQKDKAALERIKKFTQPSSKNLTESDFDFGPERSKNIEIVKNVPNEESGYYAIIAVHTDTKKRDEFLTKVVSMGEKDVNFFFDVTTNKYYIYINKYRSVGQATTEVNKKSDKPYNSKITLVRIQN